MTERQRPPSLSGAVDMFPASWTDGVRSAPSPEHRRRNHLHDVRSQRVPESPAMTRIDWDKRKRQDSARPGPHKPRPISQNPATPKQLRYLKHLAEQTGTTFASVRTSPAASAEIARLKQLLQ
jgi:hypothetical protein